MATGSTSTSTTISEPTGYKVFAQMAWGSNDDSEGAAELSVGQSSDSNAQGRIEWTSNDPGTATDTGGIAFVSEAKPGGSSGVELSIDGGDPDPVIYTGQTYGAIASVKVIAAVQTNAMTELSEVEVKFFKNGTLVETYISTPMIADTRTSSNSTEQVVLTVTPSHSDNDDVQVSGVIRFAFDDGTYPDVLDLFGQIFVFAAN